MSDYVRANYLDASAIIKILVPEEGDSSPLVEYFKRDECFYMTTLCFAEALGVLKAKHFNRRRGDCITQKGYLNRLSLLTAYIRNQRIHLDEVPFTDPATFEEMESIVKQYNIDISDALQIVTIKNGKFSRFAGESQSLLITADGDLAEAARKESLLVWDCVHDPLPTRRFKPIASGTI